MTSSIAAINIAKSQLGLDEDTYRAKLKNITGKSSLRAMTELERQKVLTVLRGQGFKPAAKRGLTGKYAGKLQALWIAGYNLGLIRDRRDSALEAFVKRQTGLERARFLHVHDDAKLVIEALKAWLARDGKVAWDKAPLSWLEPDGAKIAWAQWKILRPEATLRNRYEFDAQVALILGEPKRMLSELSDKDWQLVMNGFGARIRARKAGA